MKCNFCGAELNEDSKFCVKCGKDISAEDVENTENIAGTEEITANENNNIVQSEVVQNEVPKKTKKKINIISVFELIIGVVFLIVGILTVTGSGVSVSSTSFGADFYTYCYRGIVNCAQLLSNISVSMGCIISAIGFAFIFDSLKGRK